MIRERGREREPPPGVRGGAPDAERPRFESNNDINRRRDRESERLVAVSATAYIEMLSSCLSIFEHSEHNADSV